MDKKEDFLFFVGLVIYLVEYKNDLPELFYKPFFNAINFVFSFSFALMHSSPALRRNKKSRTTCLCRQARSLPDCITQAGLRAFVRLSHRLTAMTLINLRLFNYLGP